MALKITTQIGTDKGITSEAYVRIFNYQLSKLGLANFQIEIYQSEDNIPANNETPTTLRNTARNQQIGDNICVSLMTEEEIEVSYPVPGVDADGNPFPNRLETITVSVPDLSSAEEVDIFTFGYSHLKAKLVDLFGEENVVDC